MQISLYRCFKSDERISMDVYADGLLEVLNDQGVGAHVYKPSSTLEKWSENAWVMRFLRYKQYGHSVKKNRNPESDIHHVTDHGYAHLLPSLSQAKNCVSVHDLIPFLTWSGVIKADKNGQTFNVKKPHLNLFSLKYLQYFDHIISISQSTANDLSKYLHIPTEKISVIPPVINDRFTPINQSLVEQFQDKYCLSKNVKWLMVSGREHYKNHRTSLLVLRSLLSSTNYPIKLIKTGIASPEFNHLVNELGLQENVIQLFLENIDELPLLYNAVDCLLFPSIYEGFGMPVTEALACGTPVVMSDAAALPEAGGPFAIKHNCFDVDSMARSISSLFDDSNLNAVFKQAPQWCEKFRVKSVGATLRTTYDRIYEL